MTLEFPTHDFNFHLLTTSVNAKYYYCLIDIGVANIFLSDCTNNTKVIALTSSIKCCCGIHFSVSLQTVLVSSLRHLLHTCQTNF